MLPFKKFIICASIDRHLYCTSSPFIDDFSEAITCYEDALTTYELLLGKENVFISIPFEKLGSCFIKERRHKDAMDVLEKALEIRVKNGHQEDLTTAEIYFNMGIIHCETGKLHKSVDCYEEAIKIKIRELGSESIDVAQVSFVSDFPV